MNKVLVLSEGYPSKEKIYNQAFIHSRNIEYIKQGVSVDVLAFSSQENYSYEGVNVYSEKHDFDLDGYDAVVSHAPNIKNHYRFIKKNKLKLNNVVLFFHGHEVLRVNDYYPGNYPWQESTPYIKKVLRRVYDSVKLKLIKGLLSEENVRAVFVSHWMLDEGLACLGIKSLQKNKYKVINNPINVAFSGSNYAFDNAGKKADFITIRPLDGKKYAVDKVVDLANANPEFIFHIYGKGHFFRHTVKPANVEVFDTFVEQKNIPELLDKYKAAIMPTRLDAQGVMMCEMASYGIPTIVSDLPVCHEMLDGFDNVTFINNDNFGITKLTDDFFKPLSNFALSDKFSSAFVASKEIGFILKGLDT